MKEAENSYYLVSAGAFQRLDHDWIKKWMPTDGSVQFENLTNSNGVRIVDDIEITPSGECQLGSLAAFIRDRRIPLELCPTSNVHTGAVQSLKVQIE